MKTIKVLAPVLLSAAMLAGGCASLQVSQDAAAGRNALQTGKPEDAVGYLRRAVEANPNYVLPNRVQESALAFLGRAYYEVGNLPEARTTLERAVARDKEDHLARLYLGLTLIKGGEHERGRRDAEAGLKGINDWLEYVSHQGYSGQFWDPGRAIRSQIQQALAAMLAPADLVVAGQRVGTQFDEEIEKALRDEQRHSSGGNS
ncbi:MAG: tetratricopeptide repeat protein [Deltaproteobacteria bacterium]|nr:tetratricopeptide repeat protein [Deltaproteobacteria bacterium]